jgi:mannose-6-phosphate isomerase-like protein (cupin superfamily)
VTEGIGALVVGNPDEVETTYDTDEYADELAAAPHNHEIGTRLTYENDHVRVFEIALAPGERGAFHIHDRTYFWTVTQPGRGRQRFPDGRCVTRTYHKGETKYLEHSQENAMIHDLENIGSTPLGFVTVEFKHLPSTVGEPTSP